MRGDHRRRPLNTAQIAPGSTVAVFGAGDVGLSIIQGARIAGARQIIAVDLLDNRGSGQESQKFRKTLGTRHHVRSSSAQMQIRNHNHTGSRHVNFPSGHDNKHLCRLPK
jgi:Zn-dependent alcohol dehydrogenase